MCVALPIGGTACAAVPGDDSHGAQQAESAGQEASRKELLARIDALEQKLPKELSRKLIVISMKISTGWCSPYLTKEFEDELNKLPRGERRRFEKQWKLVREHEAWPTLPAPRKGDSAPPKR